MWNKPILVVDLETTGLDPLRHETIEIGAIKLSQPEMSVKGWLNLKIIPQRLENADPKALEVNGYTAEAWKDAVTLDVALQQLNTLGAGCVFAAYNLVFDHGFINAAYRWAGIKNLMDWHNIDILGLSWLYLRNKGAHKISLKSVCNAMGVKEEPKIHRAINGAISASRVLRKIVSESQFLTPGSGSF